jgi:hypothetical protein
MITKEESMELVEILNRARKALGQFVDNTNDFAITADFNEFLTIAKMFPDFGKAEFTTGITNAFYKKREVQTQAGIDPNKVHLNPSDVKAQLHTMLAAKRAQTQANTPQLEAPKPVNLEGEEWLDANFAQAWANSKPYGMSLFPPIWSKNVFPSQSQVAAIAKRLASMPEFHEGRKENARRMTLDEMIKDLNASIKVGGVNELYTFLEPNEDYHTKESRERLQARIDKHNSTKSNKLNWQAEETYHRSKLVAMVRTYGYIMEETNWGEGK